MDAESAYGTLVAIKVEYWEVDLRETVKQAGGIWRPRQRLWEISDTEVARLGLESRVVAY